jgi:hypothetical protein
LRKGDLNLSEAVVDSIFSSEIVVQNITLVSFSLTVILKIKIYILEFIIFFYKFCDIFREILLL